MKKIAEQETVGNQDGAKIRQFRRDAGYKTASAFARQIGIAPQSMSNIERGKKPASLDMLIRIADELDTRVDDLLRKVPKAA